MFRFQGQQFETVAEARAVVRLITVTGGTLSDELCDWEVAVRRWVGDDEFGYEPSDGIRPCGGHVVTHERGWTCTSGHDHVLMEVRAQEGWDYFTEYEASPASGMFLQYF